MSVQIYQDVVALTSREYRPFTDLDELLGAFLKAAVKYAHASTGRIKVSDVGVVQAESASLDVFVDNFEERPPQDRILEHSPHLEAGTISKVALDKSGDSLQWRKKGKVDSVAEMVSTPIVYHEKAIGEVISQPDRTNMEAKAYLDFQNLFARELAFYIKRYQASQFARKKLGKNMLLVGAGTRIRRVDQFVERASEVDLPVVISGPFGTEKPQVACAIHFNSSRCHLPLVEVNCGALCVATMAEEMQRNLQAVKGGTLFLNGVDEMPLALQNLLLSYLDSRLGHWFGGRSTMSRVQPRMIASVSQDLDQQVKEQRFSRALLAELDFLRVRLPPLQERREDLPSLIDYTFAKYKSKPDQVLSAEVMNCLQAYDWPDNLYEVERIMARLATLTGGGTIELDDVRQYAPQLVVTAKACDQQKCLVPEILVAEVLAEEPISEISETEALVKQLLAGEFSRLLQYHLGLQRALRYLAKHYTEDLSLTELAEEAFMSASHLSHLFKAELGESFKTVLTMIRIEKARAVLVHDGDMRITDVAFEAGFGDLSHFTKTFKKIAGCNPKDYRLRHGE